jgi:arylsulfatase A-like enzyme
MRWKGTIPAGQINKTPVTSLDAAATTVAAAGIARPNNFDGMDLRPMLAKGTPLPARTLHWRFWNQVAAREGDWKLLKLGNSQTYLFHLAQDKEEKNDVLEKNPEIAQRLEKSLTTWATELTPAGLPTGTGNAQEKAFYQRYFQP